MFRFCFGDRVSKVIWPCDKSTTGWAAGSTRGHERRHVKQSLSPVTAINHVTTPAHDFFFPCGFSREPAAKFQRNTTSVHTSDTLTVAIMFISIWSPCLYLHWKEMWWPGSYYCLHTLSTPTPQINRQPLAEETVIVGLANVQLEFPPTDTQP